MVYGQGHAKNQTLFTCLWDISNSSRGILSCIRTTYGEMIHTMQPLLSPIAQHCVVWYYIAATPYYDCVLCVSCMLSYTTLLLRIQTEFILIAMFLVFSASVQSKKYDKLNGRQLTVIISLTLNAAMYIYIWKTIHILYPV